MDYKIDDKNLDVSMFISFVNQVWQGNYDVEQTRMALSKTLNITAYFNELSARIKAAEKRMAEIAVLREHIVGYAKTRDTYVAYRKAGYPQRPLHCGQ